MRQVRRDDDTIRNDRKRNWLLWGDPEDSPWLKSQGAGLDCVQTEEAFRSRLEGVAPSVVFVDVTEERRQPVFLAAKLASWGASTSTLFLFFTPSGTPLRFAAEGGAETCAPFRMLPLGWGALDLREQEGRGDGLGFDVWDSALKPENSSGFYKDLFEHNADGLLVLDQDGTVLFANQEAARLFNRTPEHLKGEHLGFPTVSSDSTLLDLLDGQLNVVTVELRVATISWGKRRAFLASLRDVTGFVEAQKQGVKAVEEMDRELILYRNRELQTHQSVEGILASISDGLIVVDSKLDITVMNSLARILCGVRPSDPLGNLADFPFLRPVVQGLTAGAGSRKPNSVFQLVGLPSESGKEMFLEAIVAEIPGLFSQSSDVSRSILLRDVSNQRRLDMLKLEFLASVAHEIRTPLTSVVGYSELLIHRGNLPEERAGGFTHRIWEQAKLLEALVTDLLDLTRIEQETDLKLNYSLVDVKQVIDLVVEGQSVVHPDVSFQSSRIPSGLKVRADEVRLIQVLQNVVGNAAKYSDRPGAAVRLTVSEKNHGVGFSVSDNGPGIEAKEIPHIFGLFYRSDSAREKKKGTGLGLAIAKKIIDAHGGTIRVASEVGCGTDVEIWIPNPPA